MTPDEKPSCLVSLYHSPNVVFQSRLTEDNVPNYHGMLTFSTLD